MDIVMQRAFDPLSHPICKSFWQTEFNSVPTLFRLRKFLRYTWTFIQSITAYSHTVCDHLHLYSLSVNMWLDTIVYNGTVHILVHQYIDNMYLYENDKKNPRFLEIIDINNRIVLVWVYCCLFIPRHLNLNLTMTW